MGEIHSAVKIDKDRFVSGSKDNTVRLWDAHKGRCILFDRTDRNIVTDIKYIPNTESIVQSSEDLVMKIWDTRFMELAGNFTKTQYFQTSIAISSDGNHVFTGSNGFDSAGCMARLWDIRTLKCIKTYNGHTQGIANCDYLDDDTMITTSIDRTLKIWDTKHDECILTKKLDIGAPNSMTTNLQRQFCIAGMEGIMLCSLSSTNGVNCISIISDAVTDDISWKKNAVEYAKPIKKKFDKQWIL